MKETLLMEDSIAVWEGEGGGPRPSGLYSTGQVPLHTHSRPEHTVGQEQMSGTVNQIEWAVEIKERVNAEFDRVARALQSAAGKQTDRDRVDTQAILAILEDKRAEVIARTQAGYFIHDWQELNDQVRQMIVEDARYLEIKSTKKVRQRK